jgi:HTH-type transcriptional regulator/antitoxin HipB
MDRRARNSTLLTVPAFDLTGALRRIRRLADLSQKELADACGLSQSAVAQAENGRRGLPVAALARAAELAGLRLALLDTEGREVAGMDDAAVRDRAGRRFPAHLDTRYGDDGWWYDVHRYGRERPWYTFDRARWARDRDRAARGTPDDHQLPQAGDAPWDRAAARRDAEHARRLERIERLRAAGLLRPPVEFECTCPPECDLLHTEHCPCRCDVS